MLETKFRAELTALQAERTERITKFATGPITKLSSTTGKVSGWATTPTIDITGDRIENGAFAAAIRSRGLTGPRAIKLLLDHDRTKLAGVITLLEYRSQGLWIEAELDLSIGYVRDRWSILEKLGGFNWSVGFYLEQVGPDRNVRSITRGDLYEVSLVAFPANEDAVATLGKNATLAACLETLQRLNAKLR